MERLAASTRRSLLTALLALAMVPVASAAEFSVDDPPGDMAPETHPVYDMIRVHGNQTENQVTAFIEFSAPFEGFEEGQSAGYFLLIRNKTHATQFGADAWDAKVSCRTSNDTLAIGDCRVQLSQATIQSVERTGTTFAVTLLFPAHERFSHFELAATTFLQHSDTGNSALGIDFSDNADPFEDLGGVGIVEDPWWKNPTVILVIAGVLLLVASLFKKDKKKAKK